MYLKMMSTGATTVYLLLDIVDIMFARIITEDTPGYLHQMIEEHHSNFTQILSYPQYAFHDRIMLRYVELAWLYLLIYNWS